MVYRLCVVFQRIHGFEAVYAAGALCGVTDVLLTILHCTDIEQAV